MERDDDRDDKSDLIPFCGALLCPRTLETRPDFRSYFGTSIAFASKLNPRDGDTLEDFMERRLNFLVTVNLDRLYQGPYSIHENRHIMTSILITVVFRAFFGDPRVRNKNCEFLIGVSLS